MTKLLARTLTCPRVTYDVRQALLSVYDGDELHAVSVRPKAHRLLAYMATRNREAGGRVVLCTRAELLEAVWPGERGRTPEELAHLVWEIRKRLAPFGSDTVLTNVRGLGYRLHASDPNSLAQTPHREQARGRRLSRLRTKRDRVAAATALLVVAGATVAVFVMTAGGGPERVSAAVANGMTEFALPFPTSRPAYITAGPDGDLWFTEYDGNKIGRITPSGAIREYPIPTPNSGPEGLTFGPAGDTWFAESQGNKVGFITASGSIVQFSLPHANSGPESVTTGPDGAVWFTEDAHRIGRITLSGTIKEFPVPTSLVPSDITLGPDGNLWFDSPYTGPGGARADHRIGRITPNGQLAIFSLPTADSAPGAITASGKSIWVAEVEAGKIAQVSKTGAITEFPLPTATSRPADLAPSSDGGVWFTEKAQDKIGHISPDGKIREYAVPTANGGPHGIAVAADGKVWFTEIEGSRIGVLRPRQ